MLAAALVLTIAGAAQAHGGTFDRIYRPGGR